MEALAGRLDRDARRALWALAVWSVLLFAGTLEHQPSFQTDFAGYAGFVTTPRFLAGHLVASILGAGIGALGFVALAVVLAFRRRRRLAYWALMMSILGNALATSVFGVAAFAQPAIGRAYQAGHTAEATAINADVYGTPLVVTALLGVVLLSAGLVTFGVAVARSGSLPAVAGIVVAVGGPVFSLVGLALANVVQSIGAALLVAGTTWIAWAARKPAAAGEPEPSASATRAPEPGRE